VHIGSTQGKLNISIAREMWVFGILTGVLLLLTLGTWFLWEWRNRVLDRAAAAKEKLMI
jgi:hypothetical protein